jgi:hypothetical protein
MHVQHGIELPSPGELGFIQGLGGTGTFLVLSAHVERVFNFSSSALRNHFTVFTRQSLHTCPIPDLFHVRGSLQQLEVRNYIQSLMIH